MGYIDIIQEENESVRERFDLVSGRIEEIFQEGMEENWKKGFNEVRQKPFEEFFRITAGFLLKIRDTFFLVEEGLEDVSMDVLHQLNHDLYKFISDKSFQIEHLSSKGENSNISYENSYANPSYAHKKLGSKYGSILCFLFTELQGMIPYVFERRLFDITIDMELFVYLYGYFQNEEEPDYENIQSAIYYHFSDYSEGMLDKRIREMVDPSMSFAVDIIMKSNLEDLRYLYKFGEFITENEIKMASYLNSLDEEEVKKLANTFTEGFRRGFINNHIDLSKKSVVNIRYSIGFERIVRESILQFQNMSLRPTIYRCAVSSIHKKQHLKIGFSSTSSCRQYDYDHRFDDGIYLDKAFVERKLTGLRKAYEKYELLAKQYAGPGVIEIFGEHPFEPLEKSENIRLTKKQQKLFVSYQRDAGLITNEFIPSEEHSFTIISYPIPEIGPDFKAIFKETQRVNTLNVEQYERIQQKIIDALDRGTKVVVKGKGENKTHLQVMLHPLLHPMKETNFENCLADVNIPLGEVFTSPVLDGTEGILHVKEVYLNDLKYIDLELRFHNGMIEEYTCKNFKEEEKNRSFVKENLMYQRDTLPIGEFAIGTNTTAYKMGRKFGISHKLPILIAEKTGPHFAVGDTCYKMSEENKIWNPDGKEIIAKDNECSILRKTEIEKAYFNCHTDITIPYDELGEIVVLGQNGEETLIIKDGFFVLEGTEGLNEALAGGDKESRIRDSLSFC